MKTLPYLKTLVLATLFASNFTSSAQIELFERMTAGMLVNRIDRQSNTNASPSAYYSFSHFNQAYVPITGNVVSNNLKWDEMDFTIPIGFNFSIYGTTANTITINSGSSLTFNDPVADTSLTFVSPLLEDIIDKAYNPNTDNEGDAGGISDISYETVGTPGNRICKIQVSNAAFYQEKSLQLSNPSTINYQIWLYEGTNDIEFHYGTMTIENASVNLLNGSNGFMCGLIGQMSIFNFTSPESNMLHGSFNNPSMVASDPTMTNVISGNVTSGTVYKFSYTNIVTGIDKNAGKQAKGIYPNPSSGMLSFNLADGGRNAREINIYDLSGKLIVKVPYTSTLNVEHLKSGVYLLTVCDGNQASILSSKLVITR